MGFIFILYGLCVNFIVGLVWTYKSYEYYLVIKVDTDNKSISIPFYFEDESVFPIERAMGYCLITSFAEYQFVDFTW